MSKSNALESKKYILLYSKEQDVVLSLGVDAITKIVQQLTGSHYFKCPDCPTTWDWNQQIYYPVQG